MSRGVILVLLVWLGVSFVAAPLIGMAIRRTGRRAPAPEPTPVFATSPARVAAPFVDFRRVSTDSVAQPAPVPSVQVAISSLATAPVPDDRQAMERIIEDGAFTIAFQPIVDLRDGRTVGSEALTRFLDGAHPEPRFDGAQAMGLGTQLELATMRMALTHADQLPADGFIALNVTPKLLYERDELASLIDELHRDVVLEVCERFPIDSYAGLLASFEQFGSHVSLAVDDVGSGYASLRHIERLRPRFVKLDRSCITHIDDEPAARAIVAAIRHVAAAIGATVVAEGVETVRQRDALADLGVECGQGWLLGRPMPVAVSLTATAHTAKH